MRETYFNHTAFIKEATRLTKETAPKEEDLTISVPDKLEEIICREAFYCSALGEEMPSRVVLHGLAIISLIKRGAYIDFRYDTRSMPFNFLDLEDAENILSVAGGLESSSDGEIEVCLNPLAHSLIDNQRSENGVSSEINFTALAGLINYVGTSERAGLSLAIHEDSAAQG